MNPFCRRLTGIVAPLFLAAVIASSNSVLAQGVPMPSPVPSTGYVPANGLNVYYETHGNGPPVVLLHGGVNPAEVFGAPLAMLAGNHRVIAIHLQGHGKTRDGARPMRYELMADDVAAVMSHLGVARAAVMGYSMGAGVALQMAFRHPGRVTKLVVVSMPFREDGLHAEVRAAFRKMPSNAAVIAGHLRASPLAKMYPETDWEMLFKKLGEMNAQPFDWSKSVEALKMPTLLVFADADSVSVGHMSDFYKALDGGQRDAGQDGANRTSNRLAVMPGATHYNLMANPKVTEYAIQFLAD